MLGADACKLQRSPKGHAGVTVEPLLCRPTDARRSGQLMDGCLTTGFSFWIVKLSRSARLDARRSSHACLPARSKRFMKLRRAPGVTVDPLLCRPRLPSQ